MAMSNFFWMVTGLVAALGSGGFFLRKSWHSKRGPVVRMCWAAAGFIFLYEAWELILLVGRKSPETALYATLAGILALLAIVNAIKLVREK